MELQPLNNSNKLASNVAEDDAAHRRSLSATEAFHLGREKHIEDYIMTRVFEALAKNRLALPTCIIIEKKHVQVIKRGDTEQEHPNDMTFRITLHPKHGAISSEMSTDISNYETSAKKHWTLMREDDDLLLKCSTSTFPDFDDVIDTFSARLSPTAFKYLWTYPHPRGTISHCFYNTENVESGTPLEFSEYISNNISKTSPNQYWTRVSNTDGTKDLSFFTQSDSAQLQESSHTLHEVVSFGPEENTQTYSYEHTYHGPRIPKDIIHIAHHSVTLDSYGRIIHIAITWEKDGLTKASHTAWIVNYSPLAEFKNVEFF